MIKLGITGLIGSGKTTVSNIIKTLSFPVYNADFEAKILMNSNLEIIEGLIERYGQEIYINKQLNKDLLSSIIFNNENERLFVNSLVHPIVIKDFMNWCNLQNAKLIFIESAILFEAKIDKLVDKIIIVKADETLILNRIMERDKISLEEAEKKIKIQNKNFDNIDSSLNKILYINNNEKDSLILQSEEIINFLLK